MSRVFQWIIIILVLTALGGGYWYWKNARAGQTVAVGSSSDRADFEAPLKTGLELAAGSGVAAYSRADGADRRATMTDFEGIIRSVKSGEARFEGARRVENLLTYSEAFDNAVWTKTGVAVAANQENGLDGTLSTDILSGLDTAADRLEYSTTINPASRIFVFSLWMKGTGTIHLGQPSFGVSTYDSPQITLSNQWKRYSFTQVFLATDTGVLVPRIVFRSGDTASSVAIWGAQIEEVTGQANQNPGEYVSTNVKTAFPYHGAGVDGVKYFDYQNGNTVASSVVTEARGAAIADATLKGYLAEGARTNQSLQSESIDNVSWSKSDSTITAESIVSPDGKITADLVTEGTGGGAAVGQNIAVSAATNYAFSSYIKAGNHDWTRVVVFQQSNTNNQFRVWVNATTGVLGTANATGTGTYLASSIQSVGNGWYRVSVVGTLPATDATIATISASANNSTTRVNGGTRYVWGVQLEQGLFASSYIPTTTASVTRAVDNLQYPVLNNFNDSAGTVSLDVTTEWTSGVGFSTKWIDTVVASQRLSIWHWSGSANMIVVDRNGNGGVRNNFDYTGSAITAWTRMSLAQRWTNTANSSFRDGVLSGSDTTLTLPYDPLSGNIYVGRGFNTGDDAFSTIRNVRSWKQAMSDTFINNLTAGQSGVEKKTTEKSSDNTGLVGYWSFEDGRGTQATDFSPAGDNTGTLTNGPTWTDGKMGRALSFASASSQRVVMGNVSALKNNSFTYSAWVNPSSTAAAMTIFSGGANSTPRMRIGAGGNITITNTNITVMGTSTGTILANTWSHVAVTYNSASGDYVLYINGVASGSGTSAQTWDFSSASFEIGRNGAANNEYFNGKIDEVRVYGGVIAATEIASLYGESAHTTINDSRNSILTNGLVGQWSFNGPDVSGTTAYDGSGQGNNGTLTGGPTAIPGKIGQALNFDGVNDYINIGDTTFNGQFAFSTWLYTDNNSQTGIIFGEDTGTGGSMSPKIGIAAGNFFVRIVNLGNSDSAVTVPVSNQWHHLVVTRDSAGKIDLYVDGGSANRLFGDVAQPNAYVLDKLGANGSIIDQNFSGRLDEVRIYNRALSQSEINDLYLMGR